MTSEDRSTRDFFFRWVIIIGVVNLVILSVMAAGLLANFGSTTDELKGVQARQALLAQKLRTSNIISCERGATLVAYEIVEAGRGTRNPGVQQQEAYNLFRLRDCERSEAEGRRVFLSDDQADAFIDGVASRMGVLNWDKRPKQGD